MHMPGTAFVTKEEDTRCGFIGHFRFQHCNWMWRFQLLQTLRPAFRFLTLHLCSRAGVYKGQVAVMFGHQPFQQVTASLRAFRPAELDLLSTVARCHLCAVAVFTTTLKRRPSRAEFLTENEVADSCDVCTSFGMLQLLSPAPSIRHRFNSVWCSVPCTCQFRTEP